MWRRVRIEQAADIISGGTPSRSLAKFWGDGIAWATPTDITACRRPVISETADSITREGLLNSSAKQLPAGSILLTSRATIGEARIAGVPISTNQGFKSLVPKPGYDATFLYYQILALRGQFERYGVGSTFPEISKRDVARVEFDCPDDEEEQRRIGRILWSVDTQITHTEALTAKQEQVRAGLMQDLLTRGVDETGRLRPPREEAPELYHETGLGWLPKEWEVRPAERMCSAIIDCKNRTPPPAEEGYPVFRTPNVRDGCFIEQNLEWTDQKSYEEWTRRGRPRPGDILFTREAPVGEVCLVPEEYPDGCLGQRMMLYRPSPDEVSPFFLLYALQSRPVQDHLRRIAGGSTVGHVRVGDVRTLSVPWCTPGEQQQIASALLLTESHRRTEQKTLEISRNVRTALLRNLITPPAVATAEPRIAAE